jgi:hypothetical protein
MLRSTFIVQRTTLTLTSIALCLVISCGGDDEDTGTNNDTSTDTGQFANNNTSGSDTGSAADMADDSDMGTGTGSLRAVVELGATGDLAAPVSYTLIAKTGITNVTGSSVTGGHVGLSPAAASFITGFGLIADSTNTFSTSASVVPPAKVYASDYAEPTPTNLTTAVLAMQTAYTDAAGRSNPDFLDLKSGNIGGETLAPGLYTWGSSVTIPDDVTLAGGANDVWIFQISNDLNLSSAKQVILSGGASAKNIFWQVAGEVTLGANSHFEGNILCMTQITLQTNASFNGRALSQSLIALDNNGITAP